MDLTNYNSMSKEEIKKLRTEFVTEIMNYASGSNYVIEKMLWYYTKIPALKCLRASNIKFNYEEFELLYIKETILKKYKDYQNLIKKLKKHHVEIELLEAIIRFEGANFSHLSDLLDNKNITVKDLRNNYYSNYPISLFNVDFGIKRELIDYKAEFKKRENAYLKFVEGDKKKFNKLMEKLNNYAGTCLIDVLPKLNYNGLLFLISRYTENELVYMSYILKEDKISLEEMIVNAKLKNKMALMYANNSEDYNSKYAIRFKNYIKDELEFEKILYSLCDSDEFYELCINKLSYDGGKKVLYEGLKKGFSIEELFNLFFGKLSMSFENIGIIYKLIDMGYYDISDIKGNLTLEKPLKIPLQKNIDTCSDLDKVLLLKRIDEYRNKLNNRLLVSTGGRI